MRNKALQVSAMMVFLLMAAFSVSSAEEKTIKMSTTTSTEASGLLDILLPEFQKDTGIQVKVIAKGTGAAIRDGMDGNVDVIFVHDTEREEKFVKEGYGTKRYAVMHNDFIVLGPPDDPAGVKAAEKASAALKKIASSGVSFVSRGDDSGTHAKEQALWKASGIALESKDISMVKKGKEVKFSTVFPAEMGSRYLSIGQGMGKVILFADEKKAYTLADRGTFIKYKFSGEAATRLELEIMMEGDPLLFNPYGVIPVDPKKHPHVKFDLATQFADWLVSKRGQSLIAGYQLLGQQLFYPDAVK